MPRILWEESVELSLTDLANTEREAAGTQIRAIAARVITKYDPSFQLDPKRDTVIDFDVRSPLADGDNDVIITIRGKHKPDRVENSDNIGDEIWAEVDPIMTSLRVTWSLSLCWDEYYYRDK